MPVLTELVDKYDGFEIVRDQIARILVIESAHQQELAIVALKDPSLWRLRVFTERSNPWAEFATLPTDVAADTSPIINVSYDSSRFPRGTGNVVEEQRASAVFFIDCYGYGQSRDLSTGHQPGDEEAALEAQRSVRLVRNILMAGAYTYLGLRKLVSRRWPSSINMFQPTSDGQNVHHVVAARLTLEVDFIERAPQVQGVPLDGIQVLVERSDSGQLLLRAEYQK